MKKMIAFTIMLAMVFSFCACVKQPKKTVETASGMGDSTGGESSADESSSSTETSTNSTEPEPADDGTRVHSWISESYTKVLGTYVANDNGNVYNFKDWYGKIYSPFSIQNRSHSTGAVTVCDEYQNKTCTYDHESTVCGGVVRVNKPGAGNKFNPYSNPGLFYMTSSQDQDLLITFTAPKDGEYRISASAKRTFPCYSQNGLTGTGSRFFIEAGGRACTEGTDNAEGTTKRIALDTTVTLKRGETVCFGNDPISSTNPQVNAVSSYADESVLDYFIVEFMGEGKTSASRTTNKINVSMAKNESESFQISVNSFEGVNGITLRQASPEVEGISLELLEEHLVMTNDEPYPDGMVPSNGTFNLKAKETKTMLVRFKTDKNAKAGSYTYKFELRSSTGFLLETYTVTLTVWGFALPDAFTSDGLSNLNRAAIINQEGISAEQEEEYYKRYYDLLLDYGINAYTLPYDILDPRADAYMSDPRVRSFRVDKYSPLTDDQLTAYYNKLKTNPVWLEKAYFYPYDEPTTVDKLSEAKALCDHLRELCPGIDIVVPFFNNFVYSKNTDTLDLLAGCTDIWCPKASCWDPAYIADPLDRGTVEHRLSGQNLWWYVCWEPGTPYCNLYVNELGVEHRELFWQQYLYGVGGFLYWQSNTWAQVDNPWTDMATVPELNPYVYGDGSLLYPGKKVGHDGPCASIRLEAIRNGFEDYEMLLLAEQELGKEWVESKIHQVTTSVRAHASDDELFARIRTEIGKELSKKVS